MGNDGDLNQVYHVYSVPLLEYQMIEGDGMAALK